MTGMTSQRALQLGRYLHKNQKARIQDAFPRMDKRDMGMLTYILRRRAATPEMVVPLSAAAVTRFFTGNENADPSGYYPVEDMLQQLMLSIPGLELDWTDYASSTGRARDLTSFVPPYELAQALYARSDDELLKNGLIDVVTDTIISDAECRRFMQQRADALSALEIMNESTPFPWQQEFIAFLNRQDIRVFRLTAFDEAEQLIQTFEPGPQVAALIGLQTIRYLSKPLYRCSQDSARIFPAVYASLASVNRQVRKILTKHAVEVDLKACHAAIFAMLLPCPLLAAFLASRKSLWSHFLLELGVEGEVWREAVKDGLYATVNGSNPKNLFVNSFTSRRWQAEQGIVTADGLNEFRETASLRFAELPIVAEMMKARRSLFYHMSRGQVLIGPYGKSYNINIGEGNNRLTARAALSRLLMEWEQWLMEPVRQLAMASAGTEHAVNILAYQHDGATLTFLRRDEAGSKIARLQQDVRTRAQSAGIDTFLE